MNYIGEFSYFQYLEIKNFHILYNRVEEIKEMNFNNDEIDNTPKKR